jgi:hypothetical protein
MFDHLTWYILGFFGLVFLCLAQSRELMRQLRRTIEEWQRLRDTTKNCRAAVHDATSGEASVAPDRHRDRRRR